MRSFFLMFIVFLCACQAGEKAETPHVFAALNIRANWEGNLWKVAPFTGTETQRNHWDARPEGAEIKHLVMHYTVCDFGPTLGLFTQNIPGGRVSSHYVVSQEEKGVLGGTIVQICDDSMRGWHAGVSSWGGQIGINATSIGIENVNKGFIEPEGVKQWFPFDPAQVKSLGILSQRIVKQYKIDPWNVVGHADISIGRKQDPGPLFPWRELHSEYGVGAFLVPEDLKNPQKYTPKEPLPVGVSVPFMAHYLKAYGYEVEETAVMTDPLRAAIYAFKAHFSHNMDPSVYAQALDEPDMRWIWTLVAKYKLK